MSLSNNQNLLSPLNMSFTLQRALNTKFTVQQATLPGLSLSVVNVPTPFKVMPLTPDTLSFNEFNITFIVMEDFENYLEIWNWMIGLGFPDNFGQHAALVNTPRGSDKGLYSDGTLLIMNSQKKVNYEVTFKDMLPIGMSDLQFDVSQADVEYMICTVTFTYQQYTINRNITEQ